MADFLKGYSIQNWLEACPQGYLEDTVYGHPAGEKEPEEMLGNDLLRESEIRTTCNLVLGERTALAASSGLVNAAPDHPSKRFLATQTLDEARHVEIFTQRLYDLGVKEKDLESTLQTYGNPNLLKFAEVLLEQVDKKNFVAGVVGQNIVLEGMAFSVFEMLRAGHEGNNQKFADTLSGTIADERRHVGFGENRIGALIQEHADQKPLVQKMQKEMTHYMLATFATSFAEGSAAQEEGRKVRAEHGDKAAMYNGVDIAHASSAEMEAVLADTVLKEFKTRLGRIGLEYQSPDR